MRVFLLSIILLILGNDSFSQTSSETRLFQHSFITKHYNLYSTSNNFKSRSAFKLKTRLNNFDDTVSIFGVEYGHAFLLGRKNSDEYSHTIWGHRDFNIGESSFLLKLELGVFAARDFSSWGPFISFGINYRALAESRHRIYLFAGLKTVSIGTLLGVISPKYVYIINQSIGISAGIRYVLVFYSMESLILPSAGINFYF